MENKKRNGIVSLWKFIFSIVIAFFHTVKLYPELSNKIFKGGYIGVEFFFLISGFYFAKKVLESKTTKKENIGEYTIKFVFNAIKNLIPYIIICFIAIMSVTAYFDSFSKRELVNSIWYLTLFRQLGFYSIDVTNHLWYLTALLLSYMILCPLIKKYKENFIYIFSPLIVLLGLGYLNHTSGTLSVSYGTWDVICYNGMYRAIIEVNIGMIIYIISKKIKKLNFTKIGEIAMTILGEGGLILVLIGAQIADKPGTYDYFYLLLMFISIIIITSEKTLELKFLSNKFTMFMEKISIPIYINHVPIILLLYYLNINTITPELLSVIAIMSTIIISIIEYLIIEKIKSKSPLKKLKKIFIQESEV